MIENDEARQDFEDTRGNADYDNLFPPCFYCKHLLEVGFQHSWERWTCKAFPGGVLQAIWHRTLPHDKPIPGQEGTYVFESNTYDESDGRKTKMTFDGEIVDA